MVGVGNVQFNDVVLVVVDVGKVFVFVQVFNNQVDLGELLLVDSVVNKVLLGGSVFSGVKGIIGVNIVVGVGEF